MEIASDRRAEVAGGCSESPEGHNVKGCPWGCEIWTLWGHKETLLPPPGILMGAIPEGCGFLPQVAPQNSHMPSCNSCQKEWWGVMESVGEDSHRQGNRYILKVMDCFTK